LVVKLPSYGNQVFPRFSLLGTTEVSATVQTLLTTEAIGGHLNLVPQIVIDCIRADTKFTIREDVDNADYVIDVESFLGKAGRRYANIRKKLNSFMRRTPSMVELDLQDRESSAFVDFVLNEWQASHYLSDDTIIKKLDTEAAAISRAIELGHGVRCVGVRLDNKPYAFQIFDLIYPHWCIFHFAKATGRFHGGSEYLMDAVFQRCQADGARFCNEEPDLGVVGLRVAKAQHHPSTFLRKYSIQLTSAPEEIERA